MSYDGPENVEEYFKEQLALQHLINKWPERVMLMCDQCNKPHAVRDMQIRKAPGKWRFYFGKRCKNCARGKIVGQ